MLFTLGLIAASGWWLSEKITTEEASLPQPTLAMPDYSMHDFTLTSMDSMGVPKHQLQADTMIHHPEQGSSDLTRPYLEFYRAQQQPWRIRSETGKASDDGALVNLLGAVQVWREPSSNNRPITLHTHNLSVQPDRDYAETHEPVHILSEGTDIKGVGMRVYFDTESVELLSNVRGIHAFKN